MNKIMNTTASIRYKLLAVVIFLLIIFLLFSRHQNQDNDSSTIIYEITKTIDSLPGAQDQFFMKPQSARYHNNYIYVPDLDGNRIFRLTSDLSSGEVIGRKGRAPEEFLGPTYTIATDDNIFVAEVDNQRIQILDKEGSFERFIYTSWYYSETFGISPFNTLLVYSRQPEELIKEYNMNGEIVATFGKPVSDNRTKNMLKIETDSQNNVYCAFWAEPILRKYNSNRELVWEIDVSDIPVVKSRLQEIEDMGETRLVHSVLVQFAFHNDSLYVQFSGHNPREIGGQKLHIFRSSNGELVGEALVKSDVSRHLGGLSFAPDGTLYFADAFHAEVVKAEPVLK